MKKKVLVLLTMLVMMLSLVACGKEKEGSDGDTIILRVSNWEEYIDEGEWDEEELMELDNGVTIFGENAAYDDFCDWYYETYGQKVEIEYSTFGTNEDLYNQLKIGDVYDLVCPSDYLIMKLMDEKQLVQFSDEFFTDSEYNYYTKGVSPYIKGLFEKYTINDEQWAKYAACYMWGTAGVVYNPDEVSEEDAATWDIFINPDYKRRITIKDNVRDSLFAAMGIYKKNILTSEEFLNDPNYTDRVFNEFNDTSEETVAGVLEVLKNMKDNAYAFETDAGKADLVTGKVVANYQWSGDAVYSMDQAEEDDVYLNYAVPEEGSNIWFDGWVMLKKGINGDAKKQHAAEAFINYLSRPDIAVRNMYYIGYTSAIAGGDDDTVLSYLNYNYSADEEAEEVVDYDVSYFFGKETFIEADAEQLNRQLYAQYPTEEVMRRCAVMWFFDKDASKRINQMWINVRCFDMKDAAKPLIIVAIIIAVVVAISITYFHRYRVFNIKKK